MKMQSTAKGGASSRHTRNNKKKLQAKTLLKHMSCASHGLYSFLMQSLKSITVLHRGAPVNSRRLVS